MKRGSVVYLDDDIAGFNLAASLPLLSEQRRAQTLKFRHELGRKLCACAYLLLCKGLRDEYGISEPPVFGYGEHGKPFLLDHPDIHFSLSHCREAAICVLSDRPVGVDIECLRAVKESLVAYTMNDEERRIILRAPRPELEFIRLWTQKEAVVKCSGNGISTDMKHVLDGRSSGLVTVTGPADRYVYSICS